MPTSSYDRLARGKAASLDQEEAANQIGDEAVSAAGVTVAHNLGAAIVIARARAADPSLARPHQCRKHVVGEKVANVTTISSATIA